MREISRQNDPVFPQLSFHTVPSGNAYETQRLYHPTPPGTHPGFTPAQHHEHRGNRQRRRLQRLRIYDTSFCQKIRYHTTRISLTIKISVASGNLQWNSNRLYSSSAISLPTSVLIVSTAPSTSINCISPSRRSLSSTLPSASVFCPTVTRIGTPSKSASLNFTPGR